MSVECGSAKSLIQWNDSELVEKVPSKVISGGLVKDILILTTNMDLFDAIVISSIKTTRSLLQENVFVNIQRESDGIAPLHLAAYTGKEEIVRILIEAGAEIDRSEGKGFTPLLIAAMRGHIETVKILLQNNANENCQGEDGMTPLHYTAVTGEQEIATMLIETGADVNISSFEGFTPLHVAADSGHAEIVRILLQNKANANFRSKTGMTPLHLATNFGNQKMIHILIETGAQVNIQDQEGITPLHIAAELGHTKIVRALLQSNANPNSCTKKGVTPLHLASGNGQNEVVEELLEFGVNINAQTDSKKTALHIAATENHPTTADILLSHGININLQDTSGLTALEYNVNQSNAVTIVIMKFILKLKIAGLLIGDEALCSFNTHSLKNSEELCHFEQNCKVEVKQLKCVKVSHTFTLFDILVREQNPRYARNDSLMATLATICYDKFPIYGDLIKRNVKMNKERTELLRTGQESLAKLVQVSKSPSLLYEILEKIVGYLNNEELEMLICRV